MEPAKIIVPQSIQKVLIANNMSENEGNKNTLYEIYGTDYFDTVYYDTAYARAAVENLAGMLNYNNRFSAVTVDSLGFPLPGIPDDFTTGHIENIKTLCIENEADALILLSSMDKKIDYSVYTSIFGGYYSLYTIFLTSRWLFIHPFSSRLVDQKLINDTLYYRIEGFWGTSEEGLYLTGRDLLKTAAEESAFSFGARISPHFVQTQRIIFKAGDRHIRRGYTQVEEGNWTDAALNWKTTLESSDRTKKARAAFNLALAAEMEGLLDPALVWAEESFRIFPDSLNQTYISILRERIRQQEDLILQIEGKPEE
ncbi:MAG: tetratricopeptide repeat protein [Bacteroidales bacterium]|nr:tetratricopeptide repeat protein [Bacteroidales bacterium]